MKMETGDKVDFGVYILIALRITSKMIKKMVFKKSEASERRKKDIDTSYILALEVNFGSIRRHCILWFCMRSNLLNTVKKISNMSTTFLCN